ncbi:hypothetical protein ACC817_28695 [Rhizobium ruizarguesonis]
MTVSQRYMDASDPEYLAHQMRPTPLSPSRGNPQPNEMPTSYTPLAPSPDLLPLRAVRDQDLRKIANLDHEIDLVTKRMDRARATLQRRDKFTNEADEIQARVKRAEIRAFISETEPTNLDDQKQLAVLRALIADAEKECQTAASVLELLQSKLDELNGRRQKLNVNAALSTEKWLRAKHAHLIDDFRHRLHDLHNGLAAIIALEEHPHFNKHDPKHGWNLLTRFGEAIRFDSPLRPLWFNVSQKATFPGFAAASGALHAELFDEEAGL